MQRGGDEYKFCIGDMAYMLEVRGHRTEHTTIRRILQQGWELTPSAPQHYTCERLMSDGTLMTTLPTTGRCYTVKREKLNHILSGCN